MKTGFVHAFAHKQVPKQYYYHGLVRECLKPPNPFPFEEYETTVPIGPIITVNFSRIDWNNREQDDLDYQVAHDSLSGSEYSRYVGQLRWDLGGGWADYWIGRMFGTFNSASLPDDCTIVSAKIITKIISLDLDSAFSVTIRNGMPLFPHSPVVNNDYNFLNYNGDLGSTLVQNIGVYEIALNALGLTAINKTGLTKFAFLSDRDILGLVPYGPESFEWCEFNYSCTLQVKYHIPL